MVLCIILTWILLHLVITLGLAQMVAMKLTGVSSQPSVHFTDKKTFKPKLTNNKKYMNN